MKTKIIISALFFLCFWQYVHGQTVQFTYDENGNRINRTLVVEQLRSGNINFPIKDARALLTLKDVGSQESIKASEPDIEKTDFEEGEIKPVVYPNPTRGIIRIDVQNMPVNSRNELRVYDLNGNELIIKKDFENDSEVDISQYKDGIYILRIRINQLMFNWKIVKQSH